MNKCILLFCFMMLFSVTASAWWNAAFTSRYSIANQSTYDMAVAVNSTYKINGDIVWVNAYNYSTLYVYSNGTNLTIANNSIQAYADDENGTYDASPISVCAINETNVYHMINTADACLGNHPLSAVNTPVATTTNCAFASCYDFQEADNDGFTFTSSDMDAWTEFTMIAFVQADNYDDNNPVIMTSNQDAAFGMFMLRVDEAGGNKFKTSIGDGSVEKIVTSGNIAATGNKFMVAVTAKEGGNVILYVNGTSVGTPVAITQFGNTGTTWTIGKASGINGESWDGQIDEVRLFNRTLSAGEISFLYNNSRALNMQILSSAETLPNVTAWLNNSNVNVTQPITIFANATTLTGVIDTCYANVTYPDGGVQKLNMTKTTTAQLYLDVENSFQIGGLWADSGNIVDEDWTTYGYKAGVASAQGLLNITYVVSTRNDTMVQVKYGGLNTIFEQVNYTRNISIDQSCLGNINITIQIFRLDRDSNWFDIRCLNSTSNVLLYNATIPLGAVTKLYEDALWFNVSVYNASFNNTTQTGNYTITTFCNNSLGTINRTIQLKVNNPITIINYTAPPSAVEGENKTFTANVSVDSMVTNLTANFIFNGTSYTATKVNGSGFYYFTTSLVMLSISSLNASIDWLWNFTTYVGSLNYSANVSGNLTLFKLTLLNCSAGDAGETLRFMIQDEQIGVSVNSRFDGTFFLTKNLVQRNYSFNLTGRSNYSLCLYPATTNSTLTRSVMFFYEDAGLYSRREFNQIMLTLNGTVQIEQIYLLNNTISTQVVVDVRDEIGVASVGYFVKVLRYFVGSNEYKLLTILEIDNDGKSEAWFKEDEKYRYIIQDGVEVVGTYGDFLLICTATPCVKQFAIQRGTIGEYLQYFGSVSMSCNETGDINSQGYECVYTDIGGGLENICLNVYSTGLYGRLNCSECSGGSAGVLSCYLGNITGKRFSYQVIAALGTGTSRQLLTSGIFGTALETSAFAETGLFASTMITITMGMMGMFNPVAAIVMTFGAVLASVGLGIITVGEAALVSLLVAGAIMAKKAKS